MIASYSSKLRYNVGEGAAIALFGWSTHSHRSWYNYKINREGNARHEIRERKKDNENSIVHIAMYKVILMYVSRLHVLDHGSNASVECAIALHCRP